MYSLFCSEERTSSLMRLLASFSSAKFCANKNTFMSTIRSQFASMFPPNRELLAINLIAVSSCLRDSTTLFPFHNIAMIMIGGHFSLHSEFGKWFSLKKRLDLSQSVVITKQVQTGDFAFYYGLFNSPWVRKTNECHWTRHSVSVSAAQRSDIILAVWVLVVYSLFICSCKIKQKMCFDVILVSNKNQTCLRKSNNLFYNKKARWSRIRMFRVPIHPAVRAGMQPSTTTNQLPL